MTDVDIIKNKFGTIKEHLGEVVIHIGWHKSASTLLQNVYFPGLADNYQSLSSVHDELSDDFGNTSSIMELFESDRLPDINALRKVLIFDSFEGKPSAGDLTIMSHEEISGHPHGYKLIDPMLTAENIKTVFPDVKIIAVIRNQFDYILSLYAYRVSIRGHESRSFKKFLKEDGAKGLFEHVEYDILIKKYVELYGAKNILVLPLEMLKKEPTEFFNRLSGFIGKPSCKLPVFKPANTSTRLLIILQIWRPLNAIFALFLKSILLVRGECPRKYEPDRVKVYPLIKIRYRYYAVKRRVTGILNNVFGKKRRLNLQDFPEKESLRARFSESNKRLESLDVISWSMKEFDYPWPSDKEESCVSESDV